MNGHGIIISASPEAHRRNRRENQLRVGNIGSGGQSLHEVLLHEPGLASFAYPPSTQPFKLGSSVPTCRSFIEAHEAFHAGFTQASARI